MSSVVFKIFKNFQSDAVFFNQRKTNRLGNVVLMKLGSRPDVGDADNFEFI